MVVSGIYQDVTNGGRTAKAASLPFDPDNVLWYVVSVDVKPGKDADTQKLIVVAHNDTITKESATEALGTYAKNYQILSLDKKAE